MNSGFCTCCMSTARNLECKNNVKAKIGGRAFQEKQQAGTNWHETTAPLPPGDTAQPQSAVGAAACRWGSCTAARATAASA